MKASFTRCPVCSGLSASCRACGGDGTVPQIELTTDTLDAPTAALWSKIADRHLRPRYEVTLDASTEGFKKYVRRTDRSLLGRARFQVALSFPGEKRQFVSEVASGLRSVGVNVFYDAFFEADLARPNLDTVLQRIYHDQSDLVAVFFCSEYEIKEWCGLEWRAVRDLIKKRRDDSIMPFRFDKADVAGLFSIDGYIDLNDRTPADVVNLIQNRLLDRRGRTSHRSAKRAK